MTMIDNDLLEEFLNWIADKYTAAELVEIMNLDVRDIIERFREELTEFPYEKLKYE